MTTTLTTPSATPTTAAAALSTEGAPYLAPAVLEAVATRDHRGLRALLHDDVWVRAMLVRETVERFDAEGAVELFDGWFGQAAELQVLHTDWRPIAPREHLVYRFRLRPAWAPEVWHVIEQSGYLRAHEGRVRRLDLVCTGFVPE
jgi:hypothetical protein